MATFGVSAQQPFDSPVETSCGLREWGRRLPAVGLILVAALLVARRFGGALKVPLEPRDALLCAVATVVAAAVARFIAVGDASAGASRADRVVRWLPTVAALATTWALSLPGSSQATFVALWSVVVAGETVRAARLKHFGQVAGRRKLFAAAPPQRRLSQQLTRYIDAAGRDVVEGTAVARFAAGQRIASIHLAFCPPFQRAPEIACGAAADVAADVKVVQSLAYAARFDVKLATVSAVAIDVPVSFSARCNV